MYDKQKRLDTMAENYSRKDSNMIEALLSRLCGYVKPVVFSGSAEGEVKSRKSQIYTSPDGKLQIFRVLDVGYDRKVKSDRVTVISSSERKVESTLSVLDQYFRGEVIAFERPSGLEEKMSFRKNKID